jgi:hypothetical protein
MSKITRKQKYETILEWWLDGWLDSHHDISILTDELIRLHTTEEIRLYEYSDDQLNDEYEEVMKQQKDLGYE